MHHAVSHGFDRSEDLLRFEPIQQKSDRRSVTIALMVRSFCDFPVASLKVKFVPLRPSDPLSHTAAAAAVRPRHTARTDCRRAAIDRQMLGLAGFMDDSFVILQSERSGSRTSRSTRVLQSLVPVSRVS